MQTTPYPARYGFLDGLRGLAALCVVLAHQDVLPFGHEAVLVFFIISGYCITAAAAAAMRSGRDSWPLFRYFMWRRIRRIYPPYALSVLFFAATRVVRAHVGRGSGPSTDPLAWLQNLTLTQWLTLIPHPDLPTRNPTLFVAAYWSLNYEEQFYLVVALALVGAALVPARLRTHLTLVTGACVLWLAAVGTDVYHGFFPEYWPHFAIGAFLYFALTAEARWMATRLYGGALSLLIAMAVVGLRGHWSWLPPERAHELLLLSVVGLLLYVGRPLDDTLTRAALWRPVAALGTVSYSLYLVHQFNLTTSTMIGTRLAGLLHVPAAVPLAIGAQLGIATVFWYCCERPFLNPPAVQAGSTTAKHPVPSVAGT